MHAAATAAAAAACMRASVAASVIDTMYQLIYGSRRRPGREESNFRTCPELTLLTVRNIREYLYTKI